MKNTVHYQALSASDDATLHFKVKHFLKVAQQKNWQQNDKVFIALNNQTLIGYARFVSINDEACWLRGLFVLPDYRRQGIAAGLMQFAHQHLSTQAQQIFCFPLAHLDKFYQPLGYQAIPSTELPETLVKRYQQAQQEGKNWLLMRMHLTP